MVNLREGPGTKFAAVAVIQKDIAVSVLELKGGWSRVRVDDKKNGWMANSTISDRRP
ncbi:SH3 domain-containing protein [Agrobacterium radiobacter]|uniref:SH3 domain-containing protein n=1 Tax=Agrobacterium radiobacter TaxID=362 RepID=UPI003467C380